MHVVATAGHVDHGKSTLVRALTGTDPDRLEEEQRRGLSIQLGYAWTALPGVGDVAFVDVPGHERFITTTLAGVGPVPVAMLVVAADDPWMPQAAEHLAALEALGVTRGLLVVTRADLADPGPALARAREEVGSGSLREAPAVAVSARTGQGLEELRAALASVLARVPRPDPAADVRLWVDRRFHVKGAGTVVTGTLPEGTVRVGDSLALDGTAVRVRGLECLGEPVTEASGVSRVAVDLAGRAPEQLSRGSVLVTPGAFEHADVVDVRLAMAGRPPERPVLHVGAASVGAHARPMSDDLVRLRLDRPIPLRIGDRAILRDPGSRAMWGVQVLDPAPPPLRRRGAAAQRAKELVTVDGTVASELDRRGVVRASLLSRLGASGSPPAGTLAAGGWLVSSTVAAALRDRLADAVRRHGTSLQPGLPVAQAARLLDLPDERLVAGLVEEPLRLWGGRVVPPVDLPQALVEAAGTVCAELAEQPFAAPDADRLRQLGLDVRSLAAAARAGLLLRLAEQVVLAPGADDLAVQRLGDLPQPFSASEARQALATSRRVALPLLAHLDRTGRTTRLPDDRRRLT